jgi:hypothetical protein
MNVTGLVVTTITGLAAFIGIIKAGVGCLHWGWLAAATTTFRRTTVSRRIFYLTLSNPVTGCYFYPAGWIRKVFRFKFPLTMMFGIHRTQQGTATGIGNFKAGIVWRAPAAHLQFAVFTIPLRFRYPKLSAFMSTIVVAPVIPIP